MHHQSAAFTVMIRTLGQLLRSLACETSPFGDSNKSGAVLTDGSFLMLENTRPITVS